MKEMIYKISRVENGWILEPYYPQLGPIQRNIIYIFASSKKLAKFIKKLDEDQGSTEE